MTPTLDAEIAAIRRIATPRLGSRAAAAARVRIKRRLAVAGFAVVRGATTRELIALALAARAPSNKETGR